MDIADFQRQIERTYLERDAARGAQRTFAWLVEEIGELARAMRKDDRTNLEDEFGDCLAWLVSLASLLDVDIASVAQRRYGQGCPKCHGAPCRCPAA